MDSALVRDRKFDDEAFRVVDSAARGRRRASPTAVHGRLRGRRGSTMDSDCAACDVGLEFGAGNVSLGVA
jgi:hypothetical protein